MGKTEFGCRLAAYLIELLGLFGAEKAAFQFRKLIGLLIAVAWVIIFQK